MVSLSLCLAFVAVLAALAAARSPYSAAMGVGPLPSELWAAEQELPTSFAAMTLCAGLFSAGLTFDVLFVEDCSTACATVNATVDYNARTVTAFIRVTRSWPVTAIWRGDGIGCTTVDGLTEAEIRAQDIGDQAPLPALNASVPWPLGDAISARPPQVDWAAVEATVDADYACATCNTRAITIAYNGQLVYERYRTETGISAATRLIGWSASKSVTNALLGILAGEGRLDVTDRMPIPEWNAVPGDPRAAVTYENVLHMASGQEWREPTGNAQCLFTAGEGDCAYGFPFLTRDRAHHRVSKRAVGPGGARTLQWLVREPRPGTCAWYVQNVEGCGKETFLTNKAPRSGSRVHTLGTYFEYSTGGSTLLARTRGRARVSSFHCACSPGHRVPTPLIVCAGTIMQQRGDPELTNFEWARARLFKPLSMTSAFIEPQANTYPLGGSNAYMTSRDWLRFGLLYERDGVWVDGTRILPEGWVDFTRTPSTVNPIYGAHFWVSEASVQPPFFCAAGFR